MEGVDSLISLSSFPVRMESESSSDALERFVGGDVLFEVFLEAFSFYIF